MIGWKSGEKIKKIEGLDNGYLKIVVLYEEDLRNLEFMKSVTLKMKIFRKRDIKKYRF
jgi:hypothetical protein